MKHKLNSRKNAPLTYILAAVAITFSSSVIAVPIDLSTTGVDNVGSVLARGSIDSHYTVVETGAAAELITSIPDSDAASGLDVLWIWPDSAGTRIDVTRTFSSGTADRISPVPEPSIVWLLGLGLALIGFVRRKAY